MPYGRQRITYVDIKSLSLRSMVTKNVEFYNSEISDRSASLPGEPQIIKSYFRSAEIILLEDALPTSLLEHPGALVREW